MRRMFYAALTLVVAAAATLAAPPDVPATLKVKPGQVVAITVKTDKKLGVLKNFSATDGFFGELVVPPGQRQFMFQAPLPDADGIYRGKTQFVVGWWTEGELEGVATTITIDAAVPPPVVPPVVPPVDPTVPVMPTDPLKSFHVFFVFESMTNLKPEERAVVYGKVVEDWLNANCSGGKAGWRRREKDAPGDADAAMSAMWAAVKPAITTTPCIAMERNGKIEITNLEPTPAKQVEALTKYRGK